ncbi:MAG: cobyric acid synthase [Spirochaetales bacterium]|nr:MAG: cobyric acid synthase [Spirochaetales bacterium]
MVKHGGNIRELAAQAGFAEEDIIDFSASINPLGPPGWFPSFVSRTLPLLEHYPDRHASKLIAALAEKYGIPASCITPGNGSTELLHALPRAVGAQAALIPAPSYGDYREAAERCRIPVNLLPLLPEDGFNIDPDRLDKILSGMPARTLVFLGQPNNPTGCLFDRERVLRVIKKYPESFFCIDEAFADFVPGLESFTGCGLANVAVSRSLTKFYAVPGLRIGWMYGPPGLMEALKLELPPWSVNTLAQEAGVQFIRDAGYAKKTLALLDENRRFFMQGLSGLDGIKVYPGSANYLFCEIEKKYGNAENLFAFLLQQGIAIRRCSSFDGLDESYFRLAVRSREENGMLTAGIAAYLTKSSDRGISGPWVRKKKGKPALMLQGTSSNAGKSLLAAAFCRILLSDGYKVAPFKAQNMALNSFVTEGGGEMGRAQVVQAQACGIKPDVRMNPVLLKPGSDTGSQVILLGKPLGVMEAQAYYAFKEELVSRVRGVYDSLSAEYDVMVLEGAGSPAEVNLKEHDLVNMSMADYAEAAVLIAGDIDRGGVFASFIGTMQTFNARERRLTAGFLVNKFRGDKALLSPALDYVYMATGKKVLGIVPYVRDLRLPEEDSVTFKENIASARKSLHADAGIPGTAPEKLAIWVIDLPHISNFTDYDALIGEQDVELTFIGSLEETEGRRRPACVILPGTKNVLSDMRYLGQSGLGQWLVGLPRLGTEVVGICGGYQMLGARIDDPLSIESGGGSVPVSAGGLGLLDTVTVLEREKTLSQTKAVHRDSSLTLSVYEIHHGRTAPGGDLPVVTGPRGEILGTGNHEKTVWGTYLHGIFDNDDFRRWFLDRLRIENGMRAVGTVTAYNIEPELERLADIVRRSVDLDAIYAVMGLT